MIQDLWSQFLEFTSKLVVPDWGALVALIPVGLAIVVVLYLVWVVLRFAGAGPTRRGRRRITPQPPAGIHMPGPSFAPVLGAIGMLFLGFGLVAGGLWLAVGAIILVITLLYWGRESLRDYDTAAGGQGGSVVIRGALPAPAGTPPEGVHIPAPSFRPLLVGIAMTILVGGLVLGGWALILGLIAIVVTGLGWLWDATKEYRATIRADVTGHLDSGGSPAWPKATFVALAVLVGFALLLSSNVLPNSGGDEAAAGSGAPPAPGASASAAGGGAAPSPTQAIQADAVVTAKDTQFVEKTITVPAGKPFKLAMDNQDSLPHNVVLEDAGGKKVFEGAIETGPKAVIYDVPAIPAGQYTFVCAVHTNMTGTATAQ
jgi:plastocyanin